MLIQDFINKSSYSRNVKKGGIIWLLDKWQFRVSLMPFNSNCFFDEWINDLRTRAIIQAILLNCEIPDTIRERLDDIDKQYIQKTIPLSEIGKEDFIFMKEWDKEHYWFAYRIPPERINDWIAYYSDPVYFSDN